MTHTPSSSITPFSLFDGDLLNRVFSRIGLQSRRGVDIAGRCLVAVALTWVPMAILAVLQGLYSTRIDARNFFADYAAYAQCLVALPLFIIGERIVTRSTREAANEFLDTGVVDPGDLEVVDGIHREVERLRHWWLPELIAIGLAYALAAATILPEWFTDSMRTWHTGAGDDPATRIFTIFGLTLPGTWAMLVALPILNYWWLRLGWKVIIWTLYLYRISRRHLVLVASHPDQTGGIGFVSEVQSTFAIIIFAYGISNVAAVIAYKVGIEHAPLTLPPVWGPALGFIIGAPLLFTLPLLMFTKQLFRTKRRALALYREQALRHAVAFEAQWLAGEHGMATDAGAAALLNINSVATVFGRVEKMRVVPFDFESALQLIGSTVGSVATVLPLLRIEGPLKEWLEFLSALLRHGA